MKNTIIILFVLLNSIAISQRSSVIIPRMIWDSIVTITDTTSGELIYCTNCNEDGDGVIVIFNDGNWELISGESLSLPSVPTLDTTIAGLDQIEWNWDTVANATGYKWHTANVYASATDMGTTTTKTETGLSCNTTYTRYVWAYNEYGRSTALTIVDTTGYCFNCDTMTIIHAAGAVAPVTDTILYNVYKGIPGEPTLCWITQNLGASQEASSVSDTSHAALGWYWQFNVKQGYRYIDSTRTPATAWPALVSSSASWSVANDPCTNLFGNNWRLPTSTEFYNVDEGNSWSSSDSTFASELKLHNAGTLSYLDGESYYKGLYGYYWTSTTATNTYGRAFVIRSSKASIASYHKAAGCSVRCVHEQ